MKHIKQHSIPFAFWLVIFACALLPYNTGNANGWKLRSVQTEGLSAELQVGLLKTDWQPQIKTKAYEIRPISKTFFPEYKLLTRSLSFYDLH